MKGYIFKGGDKVKLADWRLNKFHKYDNDFIGEFTVINPNNESSRTVYIRDNQGFKEVFHNSGKYQAQDDKIALILINK